MNLIGLSEENKTLLKNIGIAMEDKECSNDDIRKYESAITEHIMLQSKINIPAEILKYDSVIQIFSNSKNK